MSQPKSATGIAAGVLAILGGLGFLAAAALHTVEFAYSLILLAVGVVAPDIDLSVAVPLFLGIAAVIDLFTTALLVSGGIMLLRRKRPGRVLAAAGASIACGFAGLVLLVPWVGSRFAVSYSGFTPRIGSGWPFAVVLVAAAATLLLALIPQTARWLGRRPDHGFSPSSEPGRHRR
ncbi:hypothetical protein [Amycolatopsis sp. SB7-3]|uniref:hypothetical protein n=1 Tax=Amycolatopsis sp. SB7-3 TaxID=3373438 RepID=UPI003743D885